MLRVSIVQILIFFALVAVSIAGLQMVSFSDQYYLSQTENGTRLFAYAVTLGLSLAACGIFLTRTNKSELDRVGLSLNLSVVILIVILALSFHLANAGVSWSMVFLLQMIPTGLLFSFAAFSVRRSKLHFACLATAFICLADFCSFHSLTRVSHFHTSLLKIHFLSVWIYLLPILLWSIWLKEELSRPTLTPGLNKVLTLVSVPLFLGLRCCESFYEAILRF